MATWKRTFIYAILFIFLLSCTTTHDKNIPLYTVENKDFVNSIEMEGIVEPVDFTTVALPRDFEGTIGYLIDDGVFVKAGELICSVEVPDIQTNYDQMVIDLEKWKPSWINEK